MGGADADRWLPRPWRRTLPQSAAIQAPPELPGCPVLGPSRILPRQPLLPSAVFDVGLPGVPFQPRYAELLQDRRFINQMVGHAALLARLRLRTEEAIGVIQELTALLDREGYRS